jgi:hypothetical protein
VLSLRGSKDATWQTWHVGEPFPVITKRVVTFVADGDELAVILSALNAASGKAKEAAHSQPLQNHPAIGEGN